MSKKYTNEFKKMLAEEIIDNYDHSNNNINESMWDWAKETISKLNPFGKKPKTKDELEKEIEKLKKEIGERMEILGITKSDAGDYPDNDDPNYNLLISKFRDASHELSKLLAKNGNTIETPTDSSTSTEATEQQEETQDIAPETSEASVEEESEDEKTSEIDFAKIQSFIKNYSKYKKKITNNARDFIGGAGSKIYIENYIERAKLLGKIDNIKFDFSKAKDKRGDLITFSTEDYLADNIIKAKQCPELIFYLENKILKELLKDTGLIDNLQGNNTDIVSLILSLIIGPNNTVADFRGDIKKSQFYYANINESGSILIDNLKKPEGLINERLLKKFTGFDGYYKNNDLSSLLFDAYKSNDLNIDIIMENFYFGENFSAIMKNIINGIIKTIERSKELCNDSNIDQLIKSFLKQIGIPSLETTQEKTDAENTRKAAVEAQKKADEEKEAEKKEALLQKEVKFYKIIKVGKRPQLIPAGNNNIPNITIQEIVEKMIEYTGDINKAPYVIQDDEHGGKNIQVAKYPYIKEFIEEHADFLSPDLIGDLDIEELPDEGNNTTETESLDSHALFNYLIGMSGNSPLPKPYSSKTASNILRKDDGMMIKANDDSIYQYKIDRKNRTANMILPKK